MGHTRIPCKFPKVWIRDISINSVSVSIPEILETAISSSYRSSENGPEILDHVFSSHRNYVDVRETSHLAIMGHTRIPCKL
jgi:hypothetical protein